MANVRGAIVPYIRLREHFKIPGGRPEMEQSMVVETGEGRCGFVVDGVLGNCQTVIKSVGRLYRHVQAISGATILGDGRVALILDVDAVVACGRATDPLPAAAAMRPATAAPKPLVFAG